MTGAAEVRAAALTGWLVTLPAVAGAQAWVPSAGSGAVSISFQRIDNTGHILTDGTYIDNGRSVNGSIIFEVDYGVTRRFSIGADIPLAFSKYTDAAPPPPFIPFLPIDQCRCWNRGWQDLAVTARYNLVDTFDHVLAVTPSVTVGVPSHRYPYRGEAVIGRRLKEVRLAVDAGRRLDGISRRLTVSGRYAYSIVEHVLGIPNDRSNAQVELEARPTGPWTVRGYASVQRSHGGLRLGSLPGADLAAPGDVNTPERMFEHDRLLRDNRVHVGVGGTYRLLTLDLYVSYTRFVSGSDTHSGHALTGGISVPFGVR